MYQKGKQYTGITDDGIWMDYKDNCWFFMIKDKVWQKEEIQRTEHSEVDISFIQKGIVDAFLLTIDDCLEPSDIPFSILDGDEDLKKSLDQKEDYHWQIVLINENNHIDAVRDGLFSHQNSMLLKQTLKKRLSDTRVNDDDLDHAIEKLESRYEPYELEQFSVFQEKSL